MTVMDLPVLMYPCTSSSFCKISSEAILWLYGGGVRVRMCGVEVGRRGYGAGWRGGVSFQDSSSAASRFCVFNLGITGTTLATKFTTLSLSFSRHLQPKLQLSLSSLSSPQRPSLSLSLFRLSSTVYPSPPPTHPLLSDPPPFVFLFLFFFSPQTFSIRSASLFRSWSISNRHSYQ